MARRNHDKGSKAKASARGGEPLPHGEAHPLALSLEEGLAVMLATCAAHGNGATEAQINAACEWARRVKVEHATLEAVLNGWVSMKQVAGGEFVFAALPEDKRLPGLDALRERVASGAAPEEISNIVPMPRST